MHISCEALVVSTNGPTFLLLLRTAMSTQGFWPWRCPTWDGNANHVSLWPFQDKAGRISPKRGATAWRGSKQERSFWRSHVKHEELNGNRPLTPQNEKQIYEVSWVTWRIGHRLVFVGICSPFWSYILATVATQTIALGRTALHLARDHWRQRWSSGFWGWWRWSSCGRVRWGPHKNVKHWDVSGDGVVVPSTVCARECMACSSHSLANGGAAFKALWPSQGCVHCGEGQTCPQPHQAVRTGVHHVEQIDLWWVYQHVGGWILRHTSFDCASLAESCRIWWEGAGGLAWGWEWDLLRFAGGNDHVQVAQIQWRKEPNHGVDVARVQTIVVDVKQIVRMVRSEGSHFERWRMIPVSK